ncbi:hypothetical protein [Thermofilum sp.]|uniref:hypothetical protein n=1 Tax=Thermofilum sp. TaxID=1961369 RepID=UPI002583580A|nr:hypothetical protein [Thermofilum sp.]
MSRIIACCAPHCWHTKRWRPGFVGATKCSAPHFRHRSLTVFKVIVACIRKKGWGFRIKA